MAQLHYASLAEIAQKIRSKELTPQEVTQHHLQRIETLQPKLNAFAYVDAENAMRNAQAAGEALRRSNEGIGPLHGVPLTVKSCIDVAGWPCAAGSMLRKDYRPSGDAALVHRLRAAGGGLPWKTTNPEILLGDEKKKPRTGKKDKTWKLQVSSSRDRA